MSSGLELAAPVAQALPVWGGNGLQCLVAWRQTLVALALGIVEALRISLVAHTWPVSSGFERVPLVAHAQGSVA